MGALGATLLGPWPNDADEGLASLDQAHRCDPGVGAALEAWISGVVR